MTAPALTTPARLGLYGVGLIVVFAAALGTGRVVGPENSAQRPGAAAHDQADTGHAGPGGQPTESGAGHDEGGAGHADPGAGATAVARLPGGLQISEAGYRLAPETTALTPGAATEFRFRVIGPDGAPVTAYTPTHERDLHLIVVRRDLSGFQHLHPTRAGDGLWSIPLSVTGAGQYRVFADFQPAGRDTPLTLGVDVPAPGSYQPAQRGPHSHRTDVGGYQVHLGGHLTPGAASRLTLRITRAGQPVTDLQPYLGAYGHLVALRDGDLAYLHVHPDATQGAGPEISFTVEVPSTGTYGLFLDFRHADAVHTAAFTTSAG